MKRKLLLLLALVLCGGTVFGIEIFSTGFQRASSNPLGASTWFGTSWGDGFSPVLAEKFSLSEAEQVGGVQIWTYDTVDGSVGYPLAIRYFIYSGDQPGGQIVSSGDGQITSATVLGADFISRFADGQAIQTIATSFNLSAPVILNPDTTYWLALSCLVDPAGSSVSATWAESGIPQEFYTQQNGNNWDVIQGGRAFALYGEAVPDAYATLPLLFIALAGLVLIKIKTPGSRLTHFVRRPTCLSKSWW